jgi:hypothetical protein
MQGVREDLIVPLTDVDIGSILESWRWLIPESYRPLFATALGDMFVSDAESRVLWLDMGLGQLFPVSASDAEFRKAVTIRKNNATWFGQVLVDKLRAVGKVLNQGECYCYLQLPMLGGKYEPENFRVYDLLTHFRIWGPLHEQLSKMPDGATIKFEIVP